MVQGVGSAGSTLGTSQVRQALFKKMDANGDGVIDKTELRAALESHNKAGSHRTRNASSDKVFAALDTNKDGAISQGEFNTALSKSKKSGITSLAGATSWLLGLVGAGSGTLAQANGLQAAAQGASRSYQACSRVAAPLSAQGFTKVV
jgi:hypothetical protein